MLAGVFLKKLQLSVLDSMLSHYLQWSGRAGNEILYPDCLLLRNKKSSLKTTVPKMHCSRALSCFLITHCIMLMGHTCQESKSLPQASQCPVDMLGSWLKEGSKQKCGLRSQIQHRCLVRRCLVLRLDGFLALCLKNPTERKRPQTYLPLSG